MRNENTTSLQLNRKRATITLEEYRAQYQNHQRLLSYIEEEFASNIISLDEARDKREIMKKNLEESVLKIHTSKISQGTPKDKRWYTPVKKGGKRTNLKKRTYEELIDALVDFYGLDDKNYTLRSLYPTWVELKVAMGATSSNIRRINADWKKYYENDAIVDKELNSLTINTIRSWLATKIREYEMDSKKFYNMQTIFKQIFEYAYEEGFIKNNPFEKISFSKKQYFKGEASKLRKLRQSKSQVFSEDETRMIKELAMKDFLEHKHNSTSSSSAPLGVLLLFQTGLRVGELVGLNEENIFEDYLYVSCEEQRDYKIEIDKDANKVTCVYNGTKVGSAKTDAAYRDVMLTSEAKRIIEMVREHNRENGFTTNGYLFVNAKQRMQENTILKRLYKYCEQANIEKRSPHKIRKTFASCLVNSGAMDLSEVASLMGHVNESTLINHYLYSTSSKDTRLERMEKCLVG